MPALTESFRRTFPPTSFRGNPFAMVIALVVGALALGMSACVDEAVTSPTIAAQTQQASQATPPVHTPAPFNGWRQNFNHGLEGWETADRPDGGTWCGAMERVDTRAAQGNGPRPSTGRAYARISHAECVEQWAEFVPGGSGPASSDASVVPHNDAFPNPGFVSDLDIYLDPEWDEGTAFGYSDSFQVLDEEWPNFRYVMHQVVRTGDGLFVEGTRVTEAGWYTFRHAFSQVDGSLAIEFQLRKGGQVLLSREIASTSFSGEEISDFSTSNVSNAYVWFVYLSDGLELPVDNQRIRIGS